MFSILEHRNPPLCFLPFQGVNPYYNYVVQGLVIVLAVSLDIRKYIAKK